MANTRVTELDFDQIKVNLKEFLRNQSQFTDYDFEGSNLSVLIDLLAYNTHYNAVLSNMISNEMFLDSAIKRSSVASLAKHLRYTPRSVRSATAKIRVTLTDVPGNPIFVTLEPFTVFNTIVDGLSLTFYNRDAYTTTPQTGAYVFDEVTLYQGRKLEFFYTVAVGADSSTKYVIPNTNVDTSSIRVQVTAASDGSVRTYTLMNDITQARSDSTVYYLEENTDGLYQIFFGDGILGRKLEAGDNISIQYLISDGAAGNISNNLAVNWTFNSIAGESGVNRSALTLSKPSGGANSEGVEDIKFNAINRYTTQGRAVTMTDYAAIITTELAGAQSVNVWGGENNVPPDYGSVYISIKPRTGYIITDLEKDRIVKEVLRPRSLVTATHKFVEPVFTYLSPNITLTYDLNRTNKSAAALTDQANTLVNEFFNTNLQRFNAAFYYSQLVEQLMDLDDAIVSANVILTLQKRLAIEAGRSFSGIQQWPGKIEPGSITSNFWVYIDPITAVLNTLRLRDSPDRMPPNPEGTGTLQLVDAVTNALVFNNIGTINYGTGVMNITNLPVTGYVGAATDVRIRAQTQDSSRDIEPGYNEILTQDDTRADVISNQTNGITIGARTLRA
jgi:hypothetical protein